MGGMGRLPEHVAPTSPPTPEAEASSQGVDLRRGSGEDFDESKPIDMSKLALPPPAPAPTPTPTPTPAIPAVPPSVPSRWVEQPLSKSPYRRDGLAIRLSTVRIRKGPSAGDPIGQQGLFTTETIPEGAWIGFYTGNGLDESEYESLTEEQRLHMERYALTSVINKKGYTWCPPYEADDIPDFTKHAMAAINEPDSEQVANVIALASMMQLRTRDHNEHHFAVLSFFACKKIPTGAELLWNYGPGYENVRRQYDYTPGPACPGFGEPDNNLNMRRISDDAAKRAQAAAKIVKTEELRAMLFDTHHTAKLADLAAKEREMHSA